MTVKQVIVMRKDLNMRKGKMAAQAAHASMAALMKGAKAEGGKLVLQYPADVAKWFEERWTKVCVGCDSEAQLLELYNQSVNAGLPVALITDAGLTEFNGVPTKTCIAVGPASSDKIDKITGTLKLL